MFLQTLYKDSILRSLFPPNIFFTNFILEIFFRTFTSGAFESYDMVEKVEGMATGFLLQIFPSLNPGLIF